LKTSKFCLKIIEKFHSVVVITLPLQSLRKMSWVRLPVGLGSFFDHVKTHLRLKGCMSISTLEAAIQYRQSVRALNSLRSKAVHIADGKVLRVNYTPAKNLIDYTYRYLAVMACSDHIKGRAEDSLVGLRLNYLSIDLSLCCPTTHHLP